MKIDDLVHDLEVEADVLRAVSHMTPKRAQEFLFNIVLKLRRGVEVIEATPPVVTEAGTVTQLEEAPAPHDKNGRGATLLDIVRQGGPIDRATLFQVAANRRGVPLNQKEKGRYSTALWVLLNRPDWPLRALEDGRIDLNVKEAAADPAA